MLNAENVQVGDLKKELDDIKYLLQTGGAGVGNGWVTATNVFLTPDERQVLGLLCQGSKTKDIADELFLSPRRVEQHLTSMYRKTQVSNRTELVRWAISTGNVQI
jgi:DNA-binding NarL/FixJ family response regulator